MMGKLTDANPDQINMKFIDELQTFPDPTGPITANNWPGFTLTEISRRVGSSISC
jgi:hypothetical protein